MAFPSGAVLGAAHRIFGLLASAIGFFAGIGEIIDFGFEALDMALIFRCSLDRSLCGVYLRFELSRLLLGILDGFIAFALE